MARAKAILGTLKPARIDLLKCCWCVTLMEADVPYNTQKPLSLSRRWEAYRPTKGVWLWTSAGCVVATIVVGFAWGGWVTGGSAERMVSDAANGARAQLEHHQGKWNRGASETGMICDSWVFG
jgi:hypothetical protein